jgi:hypothetical protein
VNGTSVPKREQPSLFPRCLVRTHDANIKEAHKMKKLITAAALTAFAIASTSAMAQDTKQTRPNLKTPTEQQMDTQKTDAHKKMGTTGAASGMQANPNIKPGDSKVPGKPTDTIKDSTNSGGGEK